MTPWRHLPHARSTKETVDKWNANTANRDLSVNALKYLSLRFFLLLLLLLAGCASNDNSKRSSGPPWYAPDVDSDDRKFFYDSFLR
jgi:hypothetical protein